MLRGAVLVSAVRTRFAALLSVLAICLALLPVSPAHATELDNRPVITYPSADTMTAMTSAGMTIPSETSGHQTAEFQPNGRVRLTDTLSDRKGLVQVNEQIDLATNDLNFTYNLKMPGGDNNPAFTGNDFGSTFVLFNSTYTPRFEYYYGALGIYGSRGATPLSNALAVEFDNLRTHDANRFDQNSDVGVALSGSHVAITRPSGDTVPHSAVSYLPAPLSNNGDNTVRITWELTDPGPTDALSDNDYTLTYRYYQGAPDASGTATVTGSQSYSHAQMLQIFGGSSVVRIGLSASTGALTGKNQIASFPASYEYTVNYRSLKADGSTPTTDPTSVKGLTSKQSSLPAGPANVGPLPAAPAGYERVLADNGSRDVTISSTATNSFTYYYRDLAPTITGADAITGLLHE